ncbi:MAG: N-6 DNA methylase [Polyangiaceae bacterium]|nr:N-6 DNA methylase [Polyangiaceae bacterium]
MPTKRAVLELLKADELRAGVDAFELEVGDRRVHADLVEALAHSKKARLADVLADLSRNRLKELCRELGLDDSGREKALIIDRLTGQASPQPYATAQLSLEHATATPSSASATPKAPRAAKAPKAAKPTKGEKKSASLGFEQQLWAAADLLRNNMDPSEYKHVVLGLIFLKYISDAFNERRAKLAEGVKDPKSEYYVQQERERQAELEALLEDKDEYVAEHVFWVPPESRWSAVQAQAKQPTIGKVIDAAMDGLERENASLKGALPKIYARPGLDKQILGSLVDLIGKIGLGAEEHGGKDILGRVYEYFLGRFAGAEGKGGGEFYTPESVVRVMVEMLEPYKGRVYDPCCGSGGMFVQSVKFVESHNGKRDQVTVYGQESNHTTWRLARMNLAIRGIEAKLGEQHADTFHQDQHPDLRADFILANPPFNISEWGGDRLVEDVRWAYGVPPASNANFAWAQHMVHHLAPGGVAAFVMANGSMSSMSSGEGEIRKALIAADLVDCVVAMPGQLFYSTQIPVCIWVLAKDKAAKGHRDRRGETLFIDARKLGRMETRVNRMLDDEDIQRIAGAYHAWRNVGGQHEDAAGFCMAATQEQIAAHDGVLTPGRYVGAEDVEDDGEPFEEKMKRLSAELSTQITEVARLDDQILTSLRSLGYDV